MLQEQARNVTTQIRTTISPPPPAAPKRCVDVDALTRMRTLVLDAWGVPTELQALVALATGRTQ